MRVFHVIKGTGKVIRCLVLCAASILFLSYKVCSVSASGEYILSAGDVMVIPCLMEIWSDQSVECVIENTDVLALDGSGRAVIALQSGSSDVFVHITNPDMEVKYTFVVTDPGQEYEIDPAWTEPDRSYEMDLSHAEIHTAEPAQTEPVQTVPVPAELPETTPAPREPASKNMAGAGSDPHTENENGNWKDPPSENPALSPEDLSKEDIVTYPTQTPAPSDFRDLFWEDRSEGGILFERIRDGQDGNGSIVKISGGGEVRIIFVCVGGREISWKYLDSILYSDDLLIQQGPVRIGAMDALGNMYYFSS